MWQKMIIAALVLTIVGAVGIGLSDTSQQSTEANVEAILETEVPVVQVVPADETGQQEQSQPAPEQTQSDVTGNAEPVTQQQQSVESVGESWSGSGTIAALDDFGLTLALVDDVQVYVELGPPTYWQTQGVMLAAGDTVTVDGFFNGEQVHAGTITLSDGTQLAVRAAEGQPLWAGEVDSGQGGSGHDANGAGQVQIPAEDWLTLTGTITAINNAGLTAQTESEGALTLQLGQANFWQGQGVTLAVDDEISVLGFWEGSQFQVGEIAKVATGERIMLRDPNGRPLWGGPGRSGNTQGQVGQVSQVNQGGQSDGGQGQGNQGSGGQGQEVQIPAEQWEMLSGTVLLVEPLMVMLQIETGEVALVKLGQVDFWTEQGVGFIIGDALTIDGYWLNGQFEAGVVTFTANGEQLVIRDDFGRLLLMDTSVRSQEQGDQGQGSQGQGNQGQGNQGQGNQGQGNQGQGNQGQGNQGQGSSGNGNQY